MITSSVAIDVQTVPFIVETVDLRYFVVVVSAVGVNVEPKAVGLTVQLEPASTEYSHLYVTVPLPVPSTMLISGDGTDPLQMVWSLPMVPLVGVP